MPSIRLIRGMITGCGAVAFDRNSTNNNTIDLTPSITVTTTPNLDGSGSGSTCDIGQLVMGLCDPGIYNYTYSVVGDSGATASAVRQLIVYNRSYYSLASVVVFPALTVQSIAALTCSIINSGNKSSSNYTAATAAVAKKLSLYGIWSSDVDVFSATMATKQISAAVVAYDVSVSATVWWHYPSVVHRSSLQSYSSALGKRQAHSRLRKALARGAVRGPTVGKMDRKIKLSRDDESALRARHDGSDAAHPTSDPVGRDGSGLGPRPSTHHLAHGGRRMLVDISDSIKALTGSSSISLTATSKAVNIAANTMASIRGLVSILLDQAKYADSTAISKVASGISKSINQVCGSAIND